MHASELWESGEPKAALARLLLTPASWLYAAGWEAYASLYRLGWKRPYRATCPVIVIGNLAVGGSGKTPATLSTARRLAELGRTVVIGCSGYGSPRSEHATLAPEGELVAAEWGDEPAMIRLLEPSFPLVVGRDRVAAAQLVELHHPGSVLLMDDGFQHLRLARTVAILLDPDTENHRCLPAGPYREPRRGLARADLVLGEANLSLVRRPLTFQLPNGQPAPLTERFGALCALARPKPFLDELSHRGTLVQPLVLPDHDPLSSGTLIDRLPQGMPIVVTAKDWVKLRARIDQERVDWRIAIQPADIEPVDAYRAWLEQHLP